MQSREGSQTRKATGRGSAAAVWGLLAVGIAIYAAHLILYRETFPSLTLGVWYFSYFLERGSGLLASLWELDYYPPFYYAFIAAVLHERGPDYELTLYLQNLFPILGAIYLTAFSRRIGLGVLACLPGLLMLMAGGTVLVSRNLVIETPLLLVVPAFAYHLYASSGFRFTFHSLLTGVWAGIGILTKWTFAAYVVGPVLIAAAGLFYDPANRRAVRVTGAQVARIVAALALCFAVGGWWYVWRMDWPVWAASAANDPSTTDHTLLGAAAVYATELLRLLASGARWLPAIGLGAGLLVSRRPAALGVGMLAGIAVPILLFSWPVHSETRYLYPLMPACGLAMGFAAATARWAPVRVGLAALFLAGVTWSSFEPIADAATGMVPPAEQPRATAVDDVLHYIDARHPGPEPVTLCVHPLWPNRHLESETLRFRVMTRPDRHLRTNSFDRLEYGEFRRALRAGKIDVLLLDCGPEGDCLKTRPEATRFFIDLLAQTGFINGMTDQAMPPVTWDDVVADVEWINTHYRTALNLALDDGTNTRFLFLKDAGAGEPAP